jgi:hypothetical protein
MIVLNANILIRAVLGNVSGSFWISTLGKASIFMHRKPHMRRPKNICPPCSAKKESLTPTLQLLCIT